MPRFSIVIPTRSRHQYLKVSVPTVLAQSFGDFEVVVQDNASETPAVEALAHIRDPRLKIHRSERRLSMHENWEEALNHTSGDYVIFIGDDDALLPDSLARAQRVIEETGTELLAASNHSYGWPNHASEAKRNRLTLNLNTGFSEINCRTLLRRYLNAEVTVWQLPTIYHGFMSRGVIDRVREVTGGVFFDDCLPDFFVMVMAAALGTKVVWINGGLTMVGWALGSHGGSQGSVEDAMRRYTTLCAEANLPLSVLSPEGVDCFPSVFTCEYGCLQRIRRRFFADDPSFAIDERAYFRRMLTTADDAAVPYDEFVRSVRSYAAKLGISDSEYAIPARATVPKGVPPFGPAVDGMGRVALIEVDGALAGLSDIGEAVRFARAVLGDGETRGQVAQAIDLLNARLYGAQVGIEAALRFARTGA